MARPFSWRLRPRRWLLAGLCGCLLAGSEPLRPWAARSPERARAWLARLEPLLPQSPPDYTPAAQPALPAHRINGSLLPAKPAALKQPQPLPVIVPPAARSSSALVAIAPPVPALPHWGAAALGNLSLADLTDDAPADPLIPTGPPAPPRQVRLPVAKLCKPERVRLLVQRLPGGQLAGEPRWIGVRPSLPLERRLQQWLEMPVPGAPSRQELVVLGVPLGQC